VKRSRLRPVSNKRRDLNKIRARLQEEAWGPRPWTCQFPRYVAILWLDTRELVEAGPCFGDVNGHEILSRGRDGTDSNLLDIEHQTPLCNHHNGWVANHDPEAERLGLAISLGDDWPPLLEYQP
jgi:hypothetical protein